MLLIGGSSSVGKTTVARALSVRLGIPHLETDLGSPPPGGELDPLAGPPEIWDRDPMVLCRLLVTAAEAAMPLIERQVASQPSGAIIEGERIHPALIERLERTGRAAGVLVVEADAGRLHRTLMARSRGFRRLEERHRRAVAEVDRLYGAWLLAEASRRGLRWVRSQPWETLEERCFGKRQSRAIDDDRA